MYVNVQLKPYTVRDPERHIAIAELRLSGEKQGTRRGAGRTGGSMAAVPVARSYWLEFISKIPDSMTGFTRLQDERRNSRQFFISSIMKKSC